MSKIPRFDYDKYLGGGAAGRRTLVDGFGDALREHGCARLQGHGAAADDPAALAAVARGLLAALESYFGLPDDALTGLAAAAALPLDAAAAPAAARDALLLLVAEVPAGLQVRQGGAAWRSASANRGELMVAPGPVLATLTAGVVAASELRGTEGGVAWWLPAAASVGRAPRLEFAPAPGQQG